jgi:predicted metal-dependent hydrolase
MEKFKVRVKKSGKILGWRLRIVDNKTVEIKVGLFSDWRKVIEEKRVWIIKRLAKISDRKKINKLTKLNLLGEEYGVDVSVGKSDSFNIFDDKKEIYIRSKKLTENYLRKLIDKKMRPTALKIIREKTKELAEKFNIKFGEVKIKNQKTRFGSCSSRGNLNFNWQIILFPEKLFEHVILHELTHILIKNHSPGYWEKLKEMDSNCMQNNRWLKREGTKQFIV